VHLYIVYNTYRGGGEPVTLTGCPDRLSTARRIETVCTFVN